MKKLAAVLVLLVAGAAFAQESVPEPEALRLAYGWDMDGEAADDDQIVTSANLADSTTFTIAAQPDSCRLIDFTVTDANSSITAGTLTIVGTDCLGTARTCSYTFAAGGSGVKTLSVSSGAGTACYLSAVTSVISGALTGEDGGGTDLIKVGYTTNSAEAWPMYGVKYVLSNGVQGVNPMGFNLGTVNISTSGNSTTVSGTGAFTNLLAGDLIWVQVDGRWFTRRIVTRTSANAVVVEAAINIPTARAFKWQKFYYSTDPTDLMWIRPSLYGSGMVVLNVDANVSTGGVVYSVKCSVAPGFDGFSPVYEVQTTTTATGATSSSYQPFDFHTARYKACKVGFKFGTGDDADSANESITASFTLDGK